MRGHFITFEGGEGSGKSTHVRLLAERLKTLGLDVVITREPGGSPGAEIIRHILLSGLAKPLGAETEAILFAAARDDHVRTKIIPAIKAGKWVICDRFIDSTRVYQGARRQGRPAADPQPRAGHRRRRGAGPHFHPRRAGDRRPGARHEPARGRRGRPFRGGGGRVSRAVAQRLSCARRARAEALRRHRRPRAARRRGASAFGTSSSNDCIRASRNLRRRRRHERRADDATACIRAKPACCSAMPRPNEVCSKAYQSGRMPHAWLIGGEPRHRQGDARLSTGALRARPSRSVGAGGAERRNARGRSGKSGRPPRRCAGARRARWCSSASSTRRRASCSP